MEPTTHNITAKQILYTILLNSDTESIVEEYVLGYLKSHPNLLSRYYKENTQPLVKNIQDKMQEQFKELEPTSSLCNNSEKLNAFILKSILSEFIHNDTELSPTQTKIIFSILTDTQLSYVDCEIKKNNNWF